MSWAAAIAGIASVLGGERANVSSAQQASNQMDFQRIQSGSAHQREVADLKLAGLNPILSGTGGIGAATTAGAMAQQQDTITPAVSTALEAKRNEAEVENMRQTRQKILEESDALRASAYKDTMQGDLNIKQQYLVEEQRKKVIEETGSAKSVAEMDRNDLFSSNIEKRLNALQTEFTRRLLDRGTSTAKGFLPWVSPKQQPSSRR